MRQSDTKGNSGRVQKFKRSTAGNFDINRSHKLLLSKQKRVQSEFNIDTTNRSHRLLMSKQQRIESELVLQILVAAAR